MATGKRREAWDMTASLQIAVLNNGMGKLKKQPKLSDLNPIRKEEEEDDGFDEFDVNMEKAMKFMR